MVWPMRLRRSMPAQRWALPFRRKRTGRGRLSAAQRIVSSSASFELHHSSKQPPDRSRMCEDTRMLNQEDNELVSRVGPGTPMGSLMRQYWVPALRSSELPEPDCTPVRVMLLGEQLIAFRDT